MSPDAKRVRWFSAATRFGRVLPGLCLLLAALSQPLAAAPGTAPAQVAGDLQVVAGTVAPGDLIPAILQVRSGADRGRLLAALAREGVAVHRGFHSVDALLVDLTPESLWRVAALEQVAVLSPDRPVRRMASFEPGHLAVSGYRYDPL